MSNFVYRKPFFIWLGLLLVLVAFFAMRSFFASQSETEKLHSLVESSPRKIRKERKKEAREFTQQARYGVKKEVFIASGPLRRLFELTAATSTLQVVSKNHHMRVLETFQDAQGLIQEELYYILPSGKEVVYDDAGVLVYRGNKPLERDLDVSLMRPMQHFRYFIAREAVYDFHTNQLIAEGVRFWTYTAEGHSRVEDPMQLFPEAEGEASRMTFYVSGSGNQNQFSAEFLKIDIAPQGI